MKPKQALVRTRATIVTKNPFTGTTMIHLNLSEDLSFDEISRTIEESIKNMQFDHTKFDWNSWVENKIKMHKWGKRKILGFLRKHFEITDNDIKVLNTYFAKHGLIKINLVKGEGKNA